MRIRLALAAFVSCGLLIVPTSAQSPGRLLALVVDDLRYVGAEVDAAGRLLALVRDQVLADTDLVMVVSTGRSSVQMGPRFASDRRTLTEAIERIAAGPPSTAVAPRAAIVDRNQLDTIAQAALQTASAVLTSLERIDHRDKHLILLPSAATSAAALQATIGAAPPVSGDSRDLRPDLAAIVEGARRAGVKVHVIDPVDPASPELLRRLN